MMIGSSRACTISLHSVHLRVGERGNCTVSSLCLIRLEMENLEELALGGKIKNISKKHIFSSWRKVMLNILGFRFSKFEIFENPKIFIENHYRNFQQTKVDIFHPKNRLFENLYIDFPMKIFGCSKISKF